MYFTDDSLLPENPPMVAAAPYGPIWLPGDCPPEQKLPVRERTGAGRRFIVHETDGRYYPGRRVDGGTSTLGTGRTN